MGTCSNFSLRRHDSKAVTPRHDVWVLHQAGIPEPLCWLPVWRAGSRGRGCIAVAVVGAVTASWTSFIITPLPSSCDWQPITAAVVGESEWSMSHEWLWAVYNAASNVRSLFPTPWTYVRVSFQVPISAEVDEPKGSYSLNSKKLWSLQWLGSRLERQGIGSARSITLGRRCSVIQLPPSTGRVILKASFQTIFSCFPQHLPQNGPRNNSPLNNFLSSVSFTQLFYQSSLHFPNQLLALGSLTQSWLFFENLK